MTPVRSQRAFTLIEVTVYTAILSLVLGLASVTYYRGVMASRGFSRMTAQVVDALREGEAWRLAAAGGHALRYRFKDGAVSRRIADGPEWQVILRDLHKLARKLEGRNPEPSAGIVDAQSVKSSRKKGV